MNELVSPSILHAHETDPWQSAFTADDGNFPLFMANAAKRRKNLLPTDLFANGNYSFTLQAPSDTNLPTLADRLKQHNLTQIDIAELLGAPDGSNITIGVADYKSGGLDAVLYAFAEHDQPSFESEIVIYKDPTTRQLILNWNDLNAGVPGLGSLTVMRSIDHAAQLSLSGKANFSLVKTHALGTIHTEDTQGYSAWPRLGFDYVLTPTQSNTDPHLWEDLPIGQTLIGTQNEMLRNLDEQAWLSGRVKDALNSWQALISLKSDTQRLALIEDLEQAAAITTTDIILSREGEFNREGFNWLKQFARGGDATFDLSSAAAWRLFDLVADDLGLAEGYFPSRQLWEQKQAQSDQPTRQTDTDNGIDDDQNASGGVVSRPPNNPPPSGGGAAAEVPVDTPSSTASITSTDTSATNAGGDSTQDLLQIDLGDTSKPRNLLDAGLTAFFNFIPMGDKEPVNTIAPENFLLRRQVSMDQVDGAIENTVKPSDVGIRLQGDTLVVPNTPEAVMMFAALQWAQNPIQGSNIERTGVALSLPAGALAEVQAAYNAANAQAGNDTAVVGSITAAAAILQMVGAALAVKATQGVQPPTPNGATVNNHPVTTPNTTAQPTPATVKPSQTQSQPVHLNLDAYTSGPRMKGTPTQPTQPNVTQPVRIRE